MPAAVQNAGVPGSKEHLYRWLLSLQIRRPALPEPASTCMYAYRFSIEELFREFKQQIGGFAYHFWSKAVPKLDRFSRKGEADCLEAVLDASERKRILSNIKAIEGFVLFASIAMGMLQLIALDGKSSRSSKKIRYLRTVSRKCPSEATVMYFVRKNIYSLLLQHPDSFITRFIRERQVDNGGSSRKRTA